MIRMLTIVVAALLFGATTAESLSLSEISENTHVHGIAVDLRDPARIHLATHHGFFAVGPDGSATRLSETGDDFMGFTPHPSDPSLLYASGHPVGGGAMGIIASADGGKTWRQIATGVNGPVDFHQMDVSRADPKVIYGVHGGLQVSRDGGQTWQRAAGRLPDGLIDLAASARDANTLYAATKGGLLISRDGGGSWQPASMFKRPVTMVQAAAAGTVYAFVYGSGLIMTTEPGLDWKLISEGFGDSYILHLAADPADPAKLYAVTDQGKVLASTDSGRTWSAFGSP